MQIKTTKTLAKLTIAGIALLSTHITYASEKPTTNFKIGLDIKNHLEEYKENSGDDTAALDIFFEFKANRFNLNRKSIYYNFIENKTIKIGLLGESNGTGFEEDDRKIFKGMEERDSSFDLGVRMAFTILDNSELIVSATSDIADSHEGDIYKIRYQHTINSGRWELKPEIGFTHYSDEFIDYYYGVRKNEATANRAFYKGQSEAIGHIGLAIRYQINPRLQLHGDLNLETISTRIENSPLVTQDESINPNVFIGLTYQF
ncbi:MAG: MipA/OmpV family protein [Cellvibrionaceae bacterium]